MIPTCDECEVELTEGEAADSMICDDCFDRHMEEWRKEKEHLEWEYRRSVL